MSQGGGERRDTAVAELSQGGGEMRETAVAEVSQVDGEEMVGMREPTDESLPVEVEVGIVSSCSTTPSVTVHVPPDFREIDFRDVERVDDFCRNGCWCSMNCSASFSNKHYLTSHANSQHLDRKELAFTSVTQGSCLHNYKVWRNFLADVVVCKPMTDLCV